MLVITLGILSLLCLNSCNREDSKDSFPKDNLFEQAQVIAEKHNLYLNQVFKNKSDIIDEKSTQDLMTLYIKNTDFDYDHKTKIELLTHVSETSSLTNYDISVRSFSEKESIEIFNEYENLLSKINTFQELDEKLNIINNRINNLQNSKDRQILYITSEVIRKSAKFWMPTKLGGRGMYDKYIPADNSGRLRPTGWRAVIYADGLGAASACFGPAIAAAAGAGPIGASVFVAAVGWSAGFSSFMAYMSEFH